MSDEKFPVDVSKKDTPEKIDDNTVTKNSYSEKRQNRINERNARKKLSFAKTLARCIVLIVVATCLASCVHLVAPMANDFLNKGTKAIDKVTGKIVIPYSAGYFKFRDSIDVKNQLVDMGFDKIDIEETPTNFGIIFKPGTVQAVRIKGNESFSAEEKYDNGDHVVIKKYVNSANYKEKYVVLFISLALMSVFVSLAFSKKKTLISVVSAVSAIVIIFSSLFIINDLRNENSKFAFLTKRYKVEFNINSKKGLFLSDYDIAVRVDGVRQDFIVSNGETKKIGPLKLKKGNHAIRIYNNDNNNISDEEIIDIEEDMIYNFNVKKKKESLDIEYFEKDLVPVEKKCGF